MMKRYNVLSAALVAMTLLTTQLPMSAQTTKATAKAKTVKPKKETPAEVQMREMREALRAQQDQINALKAQISAKNGDVTAAQQTAADAQSQAAAAAASAAQAQAAATATASKVDTVSSSVTELQTTTTTLNDNVIANQRKVEAEINSPATLHYKGVNITPGGYAAFEGVWRQHSVNSDINTPLNSIPRIPNGTGIR
jgi:chromosome segregation ATPase